MIILGMPYHVDNFPTLYLYFAWHAASLRHTACGIQFPYFVTGGSESGCNSLHGLYQWYSNALDLKTN